MEVYVTYKKRWDQGVDKVFSDYDEKALRIEAQGHVEEIVVSEEY